MISGLMRKPIKAHQGTIVDGQIVYDKEEDKVDTKILAEQTLQRDPAPKTKTVEPDETVTETAPPPESFSLVAAAPVEATQVRSVDPAPTTTTVEPDEIATDTAPPPEQLSMAVSAADLSKTLQENFAKEQEKSRQKTSDSESKAFIGTSLEDLLNKDSSPEGVTKRLEEAGVAKATADSQRSNLQSAYAMSIDQALAKSSLSSDAKKKFKEVLLSDAYETEKKIRAGLVGKQITKDIPSVYKATVKEQQELKRLGLILENDPTVKKHREIEKSINEIRDKELRPYDEKMQEAFKKFGRNSEQFKNAREAFQFQNRLVNKELLPLQKERYKLKNEVESSSAYLNLKQAEDLIYNRKQIRSDVANQFNKGGMSMEQQMSLFEEGGMKDDGLNRDPVSGNEIPPGSLAKEVRDDIPAQLSEGEYVVPADVVQYYGVKFFEDLRAEAKRGLAEMEATGRIGGEPIEVDMTMIAFGQKDKDKKEKKATGGVVGFDNGGVSADQEAINKSQPKFDIEDYAVPGFTPGSSISQVRSGVQTSAKPTSTVVYRTYYGPNNEVKSVPGTLDANGNWNADQGFEEFVKSPWTNTPKQQVSSSRDGSGPSALELEAQRRQNEYALGVSAKRLGIPLEEYKDLSLGKRFKLMGQEIQVMSGGKADPKIVKSILDGKDDGFNFTDLIGFIFNPIGSVIKLATSFIAGTDISDSPASNVNLKNKLNLNQSSSKNILPIPSTKSSGVDTSTIKGIEKASKKSDKSDKDDQRRQDAEDAKQSRAGPQTGTTPAQAAKKAKTESFREKEAQSLTKSVGTAGASKTAADITRDVMGGDLNKGGLATRTKKRKNKK